MLVPGLVLLLHVTGLVSHTVAVLHPCWREAPGCVRVLAGAASLLVVIHIKSYTDIFRFYVLRFRLLAPRKIDYQERTRRHNPDHPGLIPV